MKAVVHSDLKDTVKSALSEFSEGFDVPLRPLDRLRGHPLQLRNIEHKAPFVQAERLVITGWSVKFSITVTKLIRRARTSIFQRCN